MKELDDNRSEGFLLYFNCLLFELLCLMHGSFSEKFIRRIWCGKNVILRG